MILRILPQTLLNSCAPSAMLRRSTGCSARPAMATSDLTVGHRASNPSASHFLSSSAGRESKQERKQAPLPIRGLGRWIPANHTLQNAPPGAGSLPCWCGGHTSDHVPRLLLGVVCTSRTQQLTTLADRVSTGLRGLNEWLKY